jgi:hypothetical protein
MPLFSNSTFRNWLVRDRFLLLGQEAKGRSQIGLYGQRFDAEDSAVTARGHGADLDLSPKDRVSVMHESVSKVSVIGKGSKRARMRASGLFRIPVTMASMIIAVVVMMVGSASAAAADPGPAWRIVSRAQPTNFSPSGLGPTLCREAVEREEPPFACDSYALIVKNVGGQPTSGESFTVTDTLPAQVTLVKAEGSGGLVCEATTPVKCSGAGPLPLGGSVTAQIWVQHSAPSGALTNVAVVAGGGASPMATSSQNVIAEQSAPFGFANFSMEATDGEGNIDGQAGDHPNALTTNVYFRTMLQTAGNAEKPLAVPVEDVKDLIVDLPPGLVGNTQSIPQCPVYLLVRGTASGCPTGSQVGTIAIATSFGYEPSGVYNMVPEAGYPAEFGFVFLGHGAVMYVNASPALGYGLQVTVPGVLRGVKLVGASLTLYGDPIVQNGGGQLPSALLTNPGNCSAGGLTAKVEADSWENPGVYMRESATVYPQITGCNMLQFDPTIAVTPEMSQVDEPSGYEVGVTVPQSPNRFPGVATPDVRGATITLPEGVSLAPAAAGGLVGCEATGPEGFNLKGEEPAFTSASGSGLTRAEPGHCPLASTIGTVEVTTPVLASPLHGHLYLAQPKCGGDGQLACNERDATNGNLFGLYLEVEGSGVNVKLKGEADANPGTGQVTATFDEDPQLPFSDLKIKLKGGPRAPLANPQACGTFTTVSALTPWSTPVTPDATPSSSFTVTGCTSPMVFAPSFSAGTVNPNAASSSPFTLTFARHDGEQNFSAISVTTPPGLVGMLSQVPLCSEPLAAAGTCPEASRIGTTTVAAGAGSHPLWIAGKVYLTGPYNGAPFGLSVVVPAKAGPFNLGNVVVRSAINVNPTTSALTVTTGPLPQIRDGVPLRLQTVNVTIDRPGFMLNPTNCEQQSIAGTIAATQGGTASVSSPFAVAGCASLPFKPSFTVSTQAKTSKANGASLDVKVAYPSSGEANIRSVKVDLPKQLPSRLTTLQKACTAAVFEANPAHCPAESIVGIAKAKTPVLPVTLTGPAYLVSHAAAAFPDLVVILQGDGVRVDLTGQTFIRKGITSSTFASIPDVPVSSFELYLPEGKYSALGANGSLCAPTTTVTKRERVARRVHGRVRHVLKTVTQTVSQPLTMPTKIIGQNGAVIKQTTTIKVTGCPKAKKAAKKKAKKATKSSRRGKQ